MRLTIRALTSLNISSNRLTDEAAKALAGVLKLLVCDDGKLFQSKSVLARSTCKHCGKKKDVHATRGALTSLNVSDNDLTGDGDDMSGVEALAAAIPECK